MARRSQKKKKNRGPAPSFTPARAPGPRNSPVHAFLLQYWLPSLLAAVTFLVYLPSLKSDFVYDANRLIEEGFMTSLSNLPDVLSLKVVRMDLIIGARPGQLLYEMLIAAIWDKNPFGYHLGSNLLHAANVFLLFVLLRRLSTTVATSTTPGEFLRIKLAAAATTLLFALHPIVVEPVAGTSYASDLLMTFFTLAALLAATEFHPGDFKRAVMMGIIASISAFAAACCKESGAAAAPLVIVYWFLFRRREALRPWLIFLSCTTAATIAFLCVRFAPGSAVKVPLFYFGGSFSTAMQNQPRFWVFMMGKIIWPTGLSADYTPENVGIQLAPALLILLAVLGLQGWLAWKSKVGALGVAVYWLGLATVSNFIPLNRFLADRFYYLPLAGVALQLFAVFLFVLQIRPAFWALFALLIAALLPFTWLTVVRQSIFTDNFTLWTDTIRVSPFSSGAHNGLGSALAHRGEVDAAIAEYDKALQIWPDWFQAEINLGNAYVQKGDVPDAVHYYEKSLKDYPNIPDAENNLGVLLLRQGKVDEAMTRFEKASELNPYYEYAHVNLGTAFARKGRLADAIAEFEKAVLINPDDSQAQTDLAQARAQAAMASRSR